MMRRILDLSELLINDPLKAVMGVENVNRNVKMADSELLQCA